MRKLAKCEKARSRLSIHSALSGRRGFIQRAQYSAADTYGARCSQIRISIWRVSVKERVIGVYIPWAKSSGSTVVCRRVVFSRALSFGNRLLDRRTNERTNERTRDFLECFRCLVHVWVPASVRSDTKGELTAFSLVYGRVRIRWKARLIVRVPSPLLRTRARARYARTKNLR